MTAPCDALCPFIGCDSCEYAGGSASTSTVFDKERETMGARKTAPAQRANAAEGLTTKTGLES